MLWKVHPSEARWSSSENIFKNLKLFIQANREMLPRFKREGERFKV